MGRGRWKIGGSKRSEYVRDGRGIRKSERVKRKKNMRNEGGGELNLINLFHQKIKELSPLTGTHLLSVPYLSASSN